MLQILCTSKELDRLGLDKREVCTTEHSLGLTESVNLSCACLLAHIEVLDEPIALCVQLADVLLSGHELLDCGLVLVLELYESILCVCLERLLVGERLGVCCPLLGRISHQLFILFLSKFLLCLGLSQFLVQIRNEGINHGNHTATVLRLLLVCTEGLWWRWRRIVSANLSQ